MAFDRNNAGVAVWTSETRWVSDFSDQEQYEKAIQMAAGHIPDVIYQGFNSYQEMNFFRDCARWDILRKGNPMSMLDEQRYENYKDNLIKKYPLEIKKMAQNKQISNKICDNIERVFHANLEAVAREFGILPSAKPKTSKELYMEVTMKHPDWKVTIVDDAEHLSPVGEFFILYGKLYKRGETREAQQKRLAAEKQRKELERLKKLGADHEKIKEAEFAYIEASGDN